MRRPKRSRGPLRRVLDSEGVMYVDAARYCHVSYVTFQRWMNRTQRPSKDRIIALEMLVGGRVDHMLKKEKGRC